MKSEDTGRIIKILQEENLRLKRELDRIIIGLVKLLKTKR